MFLLASTETLRIPYHTLDALAGMGSVVRLELPLGFFERAICQ